MNSTVEHLCIVRLLVTMGKPLGPREGKSDDGYIHEPNEAT